MFSINKLINSRISRLLLKSVSNYCSKDKKNRIEIALELYVGKRKNACWKCKLVKIAVIPIVNILIPRLNLTLPELRRSSEATNKPNNRRYNLLEIYRDHPHLIKFISTNIKGLADFGFKKPLTPAAPLQVLLETTYKCNLKCKHCSANAEITNEIKLTTEDAFKILDKIDEFGVPVVNFTGGESLLRDDIFELFRYATKKGISVGLDTNGTLVTKDVAKKMKESGVKKVRISLDGSKDSTHDSFRGVKGAFSRSLNGIKNALSEGIRVEVATIAIKQNYDEIMDLIKLCEELKIDKYMVGNFVPVGRGNDAVLEEYDLNPMEQEELWKSIYAKMTNSNIDIIAGHPNMIRVASQVDGCKHIFPVYAVNQKRHKGAETLTEYWGGCSAGRITCTISPNGDIVPCSFVQIKVGNIFKDDLKKIWKENKVLNDLRNRDLLKPIYSCGGCRGQALSRTNDYLGADPTCIKNANKQGQSKKHNSNLG